MKKNADGYYRETFTFKGRRYDVTAKTERELWRKVDEKKRRFPCDAVKSSNKQRKSS